MNIGERIGDYEIVEILGSGGMGQVYKVRNTLSERTEAMKVLLPNLESDPDLGDRFLREIKVQAALDHPNIAKFHTAMRVGNQLLMFMEFVDGVSLAKQMEQGPIAPDQAAAIAAQVLDALSYAHARGVVHRDIKPANIMLTTGGVVKLMDFGIARMQSDKRLTQTGAAVGSLFYMSPEQIRGAEPDPRSDLYSLGVTLYEVVTGRRPFGGNSDYQIMSAHLQDSPRAPIEIVPGVSADLSEIILTSIAKDPAARFQSAAAFRAALASVFPGVPAAIQITAPQAVPPPPPIPVRAGPPAPPMPPPVSAGPPPVPPPMPVASAVPPTPPPVFRPQPILTQPPFPVQQPVPPPVMAAKSNRTLYMAVGSVATLALLIAAGIEGPKLMHGGSSSASGSATESSTPAAATATGSAASGGSSSGGSASGGSASGSNDPAGSAASPSAADPAPSAAAAAPASPASPASTVSSGWKPVGQSPSTASQGTASQSAFPQSTSPQSTSSQSTSPSAQAPVNAAPAPQQAFQQPAQQQAPPPPAQAPPAAAAQNREAAQLRQQYNELTIRANSAASGLQSFQQQQSRQGLGLRADIREAKTRLDYQLQEASTAIQSGDAEAARQSMRYAQSAIDTIDKFLGR